ncbi:uncharacterized protein LOC126605606 isoform X1 [Malus sylvestris]|uniref:uncharacterized protein LOC126605606 isoform X1 n=2 Tax=Malus sylvestris TaxID=3752 RepID=UPI0010A9F07C|nr:uncharacterized protein LOC103423507 isoform X1 [Malus domestica]XP_028950785.1 uncharacterized protein LOC103423507 isoform X1 [Malus domestica]XP_028950786.1 uncharacterized protein LOC103423507 isoform X1 [Malus domestica]XP_028950787.1 uncharacterized protein LOC103423507 isoform X1 [Malus domestica]XP_050128975.1 uncharacterized protein LOC126605606 isoform X1 [Malus sylvestris]XP_050128976.1 uncharacterized protein LOC126605606 isoform X1 [Malus sylvestris]XP_050128977.1 uncharacteri
MEHFTRNGCGSVSVIVYGDQEKPALITYPDLALNHMSCFQGLFFCPEADSLLLHNFCIYHISPPGHELGAASICPDDPVPSVDDLADRNLEVLNFFGLGAVMCMGLAVGGYIFSLFASVCFSDTSVRYCCAPTISRDDPALSKALSSTGVATFEFYICVCNDSNRSKFCICPVNCKSKPNFEGIKRDTVGFSHERVLCWKQRCKGGICSVALERKQGKLCQTWAWRVSFGFGFGLNKRTRKAR